MSFGESFLSSLGASFGPGFELGDSVALRLPLNPYWPVSRRLAFGRHIPEPGGPGERGFGPGEGREVMHAVTREWLLEKIPLRKVEKLIIHSLKRSNCAAIIEGVMRRDHLPAGHVGIVDVDVELGRINTHEIKKGSYYVEAVYSGVLDVDVVVEDEDRLPFSGPRTKSFMFDVDVVAEIGIDNGMITSFDVAEPDLY